MSDVQLNEQANSTPGLYLIFGYPQEWFNTVPGPIVCHPLIYLANQYSPNPELLAELAADEGYGMTYDPALHGLFGLNRKTQRTTDWQSVTLPDFKGMQGISGCGIWRICDTSPDAIEEWTPDQCKLVAIQHRYDQGNAFVHATWISFVCQRIVADYPALTPLIG